MDYDGDGRTDVLKQGRAGWRVSRGGIEPWEDTGTEGVDYAALEPDYTLNTSVGVALRGEFTGDGNMDRLEYTGLYEYSSYGYLNYQMGSRYFFVNGQRHSRYEM